ncbi:hypothetical protein D3C80_1870880 [compost metagenome]
MGVYSDGELRSISLDGLNRMLETHKNDLMTYICSEEYPTKQRDIKETKENIDILKRIIAKREEQIQLTF